MLVGISPPDAQISNLLKVNTSFKIFIQDNYAFFKIISFHNSIRQLDTCFLPMLLRSYGDALEPPITPITNKQNHLEKWSKKFISPMVLT